MNEVTSQNMKLSEVQMLAGNKASANFLELVEKKSKLMQVLNWYPTSHGDVHKGVKVSELPEGGFVGYNMGVPTSHASTMDYSATTHFYELMSKVDERFFDGLNTEQADNLRHNKDMLYTQGYMQGLAKEIIRGTGSTLDSERGLLERRNKIGDYCIDMGGTSGKLGSILIIRPAEDGVCLRYPNNANKGFTIESDDEPHWVKAEVGDGEFKAYTTLYRTNYLIDVASDKALVRLANIPATTAFDQAMMDKVADALDALAENDEGYVAFAPKQIITQLKKYERDKSNVYFSREQFEQLGTPMHIYGIPIFPEAHMTINESKVTA